MKPWSEWVLVLALIALWLVSSYQVQQLEGDLLIERERRVSAEARLDYCNRGDRKHG